MGCQLGLSSIAFGGKLTLAVKSATGISHMLRISLSKKKIRLVFMGLRRSCLSRFSPVTSVVVLSLAVLISQTRS